MGGVVRLWGEVVGSISQLGAEFRVDAVHGLSSPIKLSCISFELRGRLQKTMYAVALLVP